MTFKKTNPPKWINITCEISVMALKFKDKLLLKLIEVAKENNHLQIFIAFGGQFLTLKLL